MALLMVILKNALMYTKKIKLIYHDCLPILVLLYIMLYIMLAYLMLLAAFSNAVCLYNVSFFIIDFANAFCFHALSWFIYTYLVYFKYDFPSCAVVLICWFFLILCSHHFSYERTMCSQEK